MIKKQTNEELQQKVQELEKIVLKQSRADEEAQRIFNYSLDMIGSGNLEGYFTKVNSSFESILGYAEKDFLKKPFISFVHDGDVEKTKETLDQAVKGKRNISIENRCLCKDGSYKWIDWKVLSIVQHNKFNTVGRDITERKRAEEALRESEEKYRLLFETVVHGIQEIDSSGKIVSANSACHMMLGYKKGKLIGRSMFEFTPNSYQQKKLHDNIQKLIQKQLKPKPWFGKIKKKNGEIFDGQADWNYKRNGHGEVIGFIFVISDITERIRSEEMLKESENKFRALAEQALVGVYLIQEGNFKYVNPKFVDMFGYKKDEYLEKMFFSKLVYPEDLSKVKEQIEKREKGKVKTVQHTFRGLTKSGEIIHLEVFGSSVMIDGKLFAIGTILDISDRKLAEQEKEKMIFDLQKALDDVKRLSSLLPICSYCKKIRDDKGYWNRIESYIEAHTNSVFSHGMCPECTEKLYGNEEWYEEYIKENKF